MGFLYLSFAIVSEVFGSTMLKFMATVKSKLPLIGLIAGYLISFYLLSLALVTVPLSLGYAIWSGVGTALTAIVGYVVFKEEMGKQTMIGIVFLIIGIVFIQL